MAKKNSKSNINEITEPVEGGVRNQSIVTDGSEFDELNGELYAGLNILKLNEGQATGAIQIVNILRDQKLGKGKIKNSKPVDVYVGMANGIQVRCPIAASFVSKMKEANVKIGDTVAFKRTEDYKSQFGVKGAGYHVKVLARG